jgi:hypothetical protein
MVVILICLRIELPRRQAKRGKPVVGRHARPLAIPPNVPIAMLGGLRRLRVCEPFVLIRGVIQHEIENDANVAFLRFTHQVIEVLHRSIHRIDRFVV